ncbi:ParA family protein [Agrobacterium sp. S2/73]|uniref:ParA family protein n=1 Tax=unclassified Agrobacterium TaxID=2632611 RepID=UPI001ADB2097|nr:MULTISPECIES: ParA family protein [unclassified Agrobacterium]MBO9108709.1 ParA family protein [Agrobacterium sp. S2/73]QXZ73532.1 ParA family protein [Agrobacterium sp. S7/73]
MAIYALWNNKGGVGKSYLTFQVATEYARTHPNENVLVIDLCPQANSSSMILGGMVNGEAAINTLSGMTPARTIAGYVADRIVSPYVNPRSGSNYVSRVSAHNHHVDGNLYIVCGDEELEMQAAQVQLACTAGPGDAWRIVHTWIRDLIEDVRVSWNQETITVFIDCNPSFSIYTELAMSASDRLLIPFSADGSSKRAVRSVLSLVYGVLRSPGQLQSQFFINSQRWSMTRPLIYSYVGNRLTQMNNSSASAFRNVVNEIFAEVYRVWQANPALFHIHPTGDPAPTSRVGFRRMFEEEINDANTASVVSGAMGIPICRLTAGAKTFAGRTVQVNQSQLDKQQPNIQDFVSHIE